MKSWAYEKISSALHKILRGEMMIIIEEFNAKIENLMGNMG